MIRILRRRSTSWLGMLLAAIIVSAATPAVQGQRRALNTSLRLFVARQAKIRT